MSKCNSMGCITLNHFSIIISIRKVTSRLRTMLAILVLLSE